MALSIESLQFNSNGLIPAIAQDHLTGEVKMMAWMNKESLAHTIESGKATFWSRSRNQLWLKGESSGHYLEVISIQADCDADTILLQTEPKGPSCHTGADNCFFENIEGAPGRAEPAKPFMNLLEQVIEGRKSSESDKSYTRSLFDKGPEKIGEKIREEAGELADAIANESDERVESEAADELFHLLVGLASRNLTFRAVVGTLYRRFGVGGHEEKASREK